MSKNTSTLFQKLLDQLSVYALNETHPDAFTVIRMKKEAKKIITENQALGASAYGLIASVEGDLEESERQHAIAIKLSRKPHYVMYRSMSMRTLGKHAESYRLMQSIMKVMPKPVDLIDSEIVVAFDTGHYQDVKTYYDELVRIQGSISTQALIRVYFSTLILKSNIDLDAFPFITFLLKALAKKHHIKDPGTLVELIEDQLFFWLEIEKDENMITIMNEQIAGGLALITPYNLDHFHAAFRTEVERSEVKYEDIFKVINDYEPSNT